MTAVDVTPAHTTRVISETRLSILGGADRYWSACGCGWASGQFQLPSIARSYGLRHELTELRTVA